MATGPDGLLESMQRGQCLRRPLEQLADHSCADCAPLLRDKGITMLDAPVAGGVTGAEAGTLSIMVGGDQDVVRARFSRCCRRLASKVVLLRSQRQRRHYQALQQPVVAGADRRGRRDPVAGRQGGRRPGHPGRRIGVSTGTCRAIVDTFPKQLFVRATSKIRASRRSCPPKTPTWRSSSPTRFNVPMAIGEIVEADKQEALRRGWGPLSPDVFMRLQEERSGVVLDLKQPKDKAP